MEIRVLGPGCRNCKKLEKNVFDAAAQLDLTANIEKVEDIQEIMGYGVMSTPALVVDGNVVVSGRVPDVEEIKKFLAT